MHLEQQRFWLALLNLQRTWATDEAALSIVPVKSRDFAVAPEWPQKKALVYLLNNLELLRESHRRLEAGEPLDFASLNAGLEGLALRLHPWSDPAERKRLAQSRADLGGRLETLLVVSDRDGCNPGTRYIRATVERCLFYFAQYVDHRLSDPAYPGCSPDRWRVVESEAAGGDLAIEPPRAPDPQAFA